MSVRPWEPFEIPIGAKVNTVNSVSDVFLIVGYDSDTDLVQVGMHTYTRRSMMETFVLADNQGMCGVTTVGGKDEEKPIVPTASDFYKLLVDFPGRSAGETAWNAWIAWKNRTMRQHEEAANAHHRWMQKVGAGMGWGKDKLPFPELTKP